MAFDPISVLLEVGSKVIDRVFPDPTAAASAKLELLKLQQSGELAKLAADTDLAKGQLEVNKTEAASTNWFVSGARPFIMWGCGFAMLYASLFEPIMRFVAVVMFKYPGTFPVIDTSLTTQVLLGLLGLGGLRTFEKLNGVAAK
jgi:hypothetical protein